MHKALRTAMKHAALPAKAVSFIQILGSLDTGG